jgi:hypothetical protein
MKPSGPKVTVKVSRKPVCPRIITGSNRYEGSWLADVTAIDAENYYPALEP